MSRTYYIASLLAEETRTVRARSEFDAQHSVQKFERLFSHRESADHWIETHVLVGRKEKCSHCGCMNEHIEIQKR